MLEADRLCKSSDRDSVQCCSSSYSSSPESMGNSRTVELAVLQILSKVLDVVWNKLVESAETGVRAARLKLPRPGTRQNRLSTHLAWIRHLKIASFKMGPRYDACENNAMVRMNSRSRIATVTLLWKYPGVEVGTSWSAAEYGRILAGMCM